MSEVKLYTERDLMGLDRAGNHYCKHILAMTKEGLHAKSDIAAELAFRDFELAALREELHHAQCRALAFEAGNRAMEKRMTAAEQRNATLTEAMERIHFRCDSFNDEALGMKKHSVRVMLDIAAKALGKPTESGASE